MLRKWISFIVMLAFAMTALVPVSHAAMRHDADAPHVKIAAAGDHENCHQGNGKKAEEASAKQDGKAGKSSCCDKSCHCVGITCGGSVNVLGFGDSGAIPPPAAESWIGAPQEKAAYDIMGRIKRPPRA